MPMQHDYIQFLAAFASPKFEALWPAQAYVLSAYATTFAAVPDVAVELPTGAGKTLIALLIAEAWRQVGRKVAILSANKTLARQMQREAEALGIPAVLMEGRGAEIPAGDKRAYQRAPRVAIMNYWVYFNQNPIIDPADLLIMDDAHLAEDCLRSLYSVEIDRFAHSNLFRTLIAELYERFPAYEVLADARADDTPMSAPTELLSFIDQVAVAGRLREIVDASPELASDTDLHFRWMRLRHQLQQANIYINRDTIWIRPYIYPLLSNLHYAETHQRIYMSATVGDPSDLSRRLGTRPIQKVPVPEPYAEKTAGRRLIVLNRIEDADLPERLQQIIMVALHALPKSVWLCASQADALRFQQKVTEWLNAHGLIGHPTWLLTPLGDEIDTFKRAERGHLFVAGRFDGMDFRADECRLVVVTTLPRAVNPQEEFISAYLRDARFMKRRLNQRIIQALGRCNRSAEDYGIYILADRRFATHFGPESNLVGLPRNIKAELDMAQDLAEVPIETLLTRVTEFLQGDFGSYDADLHAAQALVPAPPASTGEIDTAADEVAGWNALFESQNYQVAAQRFERCWLAARQDNLRELGALHGWHWAKALYLQSRLDEPAARERALQVLDDAIEQGGQSAWFNRMRASYNQALRVPTLPNDIVQRDYTAVLLRTFDDHLERLWTRGDRFARWCERLTTLLESTNHSQYQEGLEQLGRLLGYHAWRPQYNAAPDGVWRGVFGNAREVITFEAKIEHAPTHPISAGDVGQAHNQLARAEREYRAQGYTVRSAIVTHLTEMTPDAAAALGPIKVLEKAAVLALWERVRLLLSRYRDRWSLEDIATRTVAALGLRSGLPSPGWLIRALDGDAPWITALQLCAEWVNPP